MIYPGFLEWYDGDEWAGNIGQITSLIDNLGLAMLKIKDADNAIKNHIILTTNEGTIKIVN